ncbi:MAG: hypothetical protein IIU67_08785, partial [Lachnospiraceae bacterium]|nr:hypothetical protein [Lachnospiraceae bacterium]
IDDIISCGVSADRHTDQNVADVPSGDLISRADTLAKIKEYCIDGDAVVQNWFDTMGIEEVINTMPSVSADRPQVNSNSAEEQIAETCDRPKGEWKWTHGGQCSECGFHNTNFDFNFCPNCGADMRGEDDG